MSLLKGRRIPVEHCAEKELWENQGRAPSQQTRTPPTSGVGSEADDPHGGPHLLHTAEGYTGL